MATSTKKKLSPQQQVLRSLNAAAKILNKKIHQPDHASVKGLNAIAADAAPEKIVLFQVFCESEQKVVSTPSTDEKAQQKLSTKHNQKFGHNSHVLTTT